MKKLLCVLLSLSLLTGSTLITNATDRSITKTVEYLEDGSYFVTTIETAQNDGLPLLRASTRSGSKTITYKSSSGTSLWSVTVTGSFTYGSTTACTSASVSATLYSPSWKVSDKTSSRSGTTARASAKGTQYLASVAVGSITQSATLTCSSTGVLS
ncbi:hypothetical protein LQZ18_12525 [Lachnospiraceae bacterium ZAX-1]